MSKVQSGTDVAKPLYADLQGDWIIENVYIDEDSNSREWQKQGSTALILRTIRVEANELYFRNPPVAGMTRTIGAMSSSQSKEMILGYLTLLIPKKIFASGCTKSMETS